VPRGLTPLGKLRRNAKRGGNQPQGWRQLDRTVRLGERSGMPVEFSRLLIHADAPFLLKSTELFGFLVLPILLRTA
jgi:hypothetical protein